MILQGDAPSVLRGMPAGSFDGALCDPPYGLTANKKGGSGVASISHTPYGRARIGTGNGPGGFMGQRWDAAVPGSETWAEVFRVLKPGAMLMAFGGTRTHHRLMCAIEDAGFEVRDCMMWLYGQGFPKSLDIGKKLAAFNGYGTALKPAYEPIIVAMKPCEGTFARNAQKHGVAGLAIDASRIAGTSTKRKGGDLSNRPTALEGGDRYRTDYAPSNLGRWPANVILDPDSAELLDEQSGILTSGANPTRRHSPKTSNTYGAFEGRPECVAHRGLDQGGASRFFYCAKASRKERGAGNTHPTVKPLKLVEYLARLILPPNAGAPRRLVVPFAGSGSEVMGALEAGWNEVVGIELNPEYCAIARKRLGLKAPPNAKGAAA